MFITGVRIFFIGIICSFALPFVKAMERESAGASQPAAPQPSTASSAQARTSQSQTQPMYCPICHTMISAENTWLDWILFHLSHMFRKAAEQHEEQHERFKEEEFHLGAPSSFDPYSQETLRRKEEIEERKTRCPYCDVPRASQNQ
jgi:hypothetical protein